MSSLAFWQEQQVFITKIILPVVIAVLVLAPLLLAFSGGLGWAMLLDQGARFTPHLRQSGALLDSLQDAPAERAGIAIREQPAVA